MRLLPIRRRARLALAVALASLVAGMVYIYRPWEAHHRGRPTSRWAWEVCRWRIYERNDGTTGIILPSPISPSDILRDWLSGAPTRDTVFYGSPLMEGDPAAVPVLIELSQHPDKTARWFGVTALGKVGRVPTVVSGAVIAALTDPDPNVRRAAEKTLQAVDPEAAEKSSLTGEGP